MKAYRPLIRQCEKDILSPLLEKTFDIDKDVDLIYNLFFKDFLSKLKNNYFDSYFHIEKFYSKIKPYNSDDVVFGILNTNRLKTKDSKKANEINPLNIYLGIFESGSFYRAKTISVTKSFIQLSIVKEVPLIYFSSLTKKSLSDKDKKYYNNYLNQKFIKSTIAHELAHWIDDSLHKGFLTSLVDLADWLDDSDIMLLKQKDINTTYFEINSQIHGIKNLKRMNSKKWDNLTLENMFWQYSSLMHIAQILYDNYGKEVLEIWEKYLIKRMTREGLLGKSMKAFIDPQILRGHRYRV